MAETLRQVITEALAARGARPAGRVRDRDRRAGHQRSLARPVMVSVPGDEAEQDAGARGLQSAAGFLRSRARRRRSPPGSCRSCTSSSTRAWSTRRGSTSCSQCDSRGRSRADRSAAGGQAGGPHVARRGAAGAAGARDQAVGHTGTLDPFATGLLVVLVGRATRLARFVEAAGQDLPALRVRLGVQTDTDDLTGAASRSGRSTQVEPGAGAARRWRGSRASSGSGRPAYSAKHVGRRAQLPAGAARESGGAGRSRR